MQQRFPGETSVTLLMNDIEKCMMRHLGILVSLVLACGLGCKNSHNPPRTMTESEVVAILGEVDDFELSDRVFGAASELTENKVDFDKEHEPLRTVSMVWFATGIIGNGGFRYLLECECGNDRIFGKSPKRFDGLMPWNALKRLTSCSLNSLTVHYG